MNRAGSWSDKNRVQDWSHPPEPSPPQAEFWTAQTARQGTCATVCEVDRARNRAASCIRARTSDPETDGAPSCDQHQPLTSKCPCEVHGERLDQCPINRERLIPLSGNGQQRCQLAVRQDLPFRQIAAQSPVGQWHITLRDMSVVSSRSRFLVKTVATQTGSLMPRPANQRNIRFYCICSINWRVVPTARLWRDPNGEQDLDQAGPDKPLGCDRGAAEIGMERGKFAVEAGENIVDHLPDLAQRMSGGNALLKINVAEQRPARFICPAHFAPQPLSCEGGIMFSNHCPEGTISAPC